MNLSKSFEFFDPATCKDWINIVGCGSVGSTLAELLARFGLRKFRLFDFDVVEPKNLANQMFFRSQIGKLKIDAVGEILREINEEVLIQRYEQGWKKHNLDGYVFLALDNIEVRREIVKDNLYNQFVKGMFDFRTGLTDAQHYAADWSIHQDKITMLETMKFSHEEAKVNTVRTACNVELCVAPTVRLICNAGVANFINFLKGEKLRRIITTDAFNFDKGIDAI